MRVAKWDSGLHWDDPNLRWGEPSYLLEPGDPGYVADPTSASFPTSKPKSKGNKMPKGNYINANERAFSNQMLQFKNNISGYTTTLGLSAGTITAQAADADRYKWELDAQELFGNLSQQWTAWKGITRGGGNYPAAGAPVTISLGTPPAAVAPGIEVRFRALVKQIKAHANYNPGIGEALGIEGAEITGPDLATLKAVLKPVTSAGGVMVKWGWQGNAQFLDALRIEVDRGDGQGFRLLAIDTTPDYNDTEAFPATPKKWTYRACYQLDDGNVGQWSDPVSVTVGA
jgi:hypothetical protein